MIRCFDIGGSKIVSADVDDTGSVTLKARVPTPSDSFSAFANTLKTLCEDTTHPVSLSIAGVIHPATGLVTSANIPGISGTRLATELEAALDRDVYLINDANAFTLAEARVGGAMGHANVLGIILGTGVGGGLVLNGSVLPGCDGTAGEWGHGPASTVRTGETLPELACHCGQTNCVDVFGGARGLERLYQHVTGQPLCSVEIVQQWRTGQTGASHAVEIWLDIVGGSLAAAINLTGPSIVPVGGGLASNEDLIMGLDREVSQRRLASDSGQMLYSAVSGPEQGLIGAAMNAMGALR